MVSFSKRRMVLSTASAVALTACGSTKNNEPEAPLIPIKSVAIIPAAPIELGLEYSVSLLAPPIVRGIISGVNAGIGEANAKIINEKLVAKDYFLSKELTSQLVKLLENEGVEVEVLNNLRRNPKDPNNIKHSLIEHKSEYILHLFFNEFVYQSPRGQTGYWPRASTTVQIYDKSGKNYLREVGTYLYRSSSKPYTGYFESKDDMSYASQELMLEQFDKVQADIERHVTLAARSLSKQILAQGR
jgi:hypothetical protein